MVKPVPQNPRAKSSYLSPYVRNFLYVGTCANYFVDWLSKRKICCLCHYLSIGPFLHVCRKYHYFSVHTLVQKYVPVFSLINPVLYPIATQIQQCGPPLSPRLSNQPSCPPTTAAPVPLETYPAPSPRRPPRSTQQPLPSPSLALPPATLLKTSRSVFGSLRPLPRVPR